MDPLPPFSVGAPHVTDRRRGSIPCLHSMPSSPVCCCAASPSLLISAPLLPVLHLATRASPLYELPQYSREGG